MNYIIVNMEDGSFGVYEKKNTCVVETFAKYQDAKRYISFLNMGGAFAGFTPHFLSKKNKKISEKQL